jgi:hypothetical protein
MTFRNYTMAGGEFARHRSTSAAEMWEELFDNSNRPEIGTEWDLFPQASSLAFRIGFRNTVRWPWKPSTCSRSFPRVVHPCARASTCAYALACNCVCACACVCGCAYACSFDYVGIYVRKYVCVF